MSGWPEPRRVWPGTALVQGGKHAHMLNAQANQAGNEARAAHHLIAGSKLNPHWETEASDLKDAVRQRKVGLRVMAVKKPAALIAGGAAAAGGAGLYELGSHALRQRKASATPVIKAGVHVFDPDSPESKAATKKHKGHFHPAFVKHIGAHKFVHGQDAPDKKDDKPGEDAFTPKKKTAFDGKFPPKKGHKPKTKKLPAAFADQIGKSHPIPTPPAEFEYFVSGRTVDGIPEERHGQFLERPEPVTKNYYYGSAPTHQQHPTAAISAAAFGGAAAGAMAPKQAKKAFNAAGITPKAKAVKLALKAK